MILFLKCSWTIRQCIYCDTSGWWNLRWHQKTVFLVSTWKRKELHHHHKNTFNLKHSFVLPTKGSKLGYCHTRVVKKRTRYNKIRYWNKETTTTTTLDYRINGIFHLVILNNKKKKTSCSKIRLWNVGSNLIDFIGPKL